MKDLFLLKPLTCYIYLLFVISLLATPSEANDKAREYKIGVILPLSGPIADVGKSIHNSILLSKKLFDPQNIITLIFEDDQFKAKNSVSAVWKLINVDHIDALITFGGSTSNSVADIAERKKIPMIAITALESIGKDRSYVNSIFLSTKEQTKVLSQAIHQMKFNRVALITNTQEALLFLKDDFLMTNQNIIVSNSEITPGDLGISSQVTKIRLSKPDAVVLYLLPPQISLFAIKLREQGFNGQFLGGPPLFNPAEIKSAKGHLNGAWLPGPKSGELSQFISDYRDSYNTTPVSEGFYGYDSTHLLIKALQSTNATKYLNELKSFSGLSGKYPKGINNNFEVPAELREIIENGELRVKQIN